MTRTLVCLLGSLFLVGNALGREPGPDFEQLKAMQWMIGDWEANWQVQEGAILGGSGTGEWSRQGDTWVLTWNYTAGDGTTLEGVSHMIVIDDDTHTWQMKAIKENGENIPDTPLIRFHRVKRKGE